MTPQWQIGDKIENRWEIHKILKGGMGIVYIVYDHDRKEALAAKTFQSEVFARNAATAGLFKREARTWIDLDVHENVTRAVFVQRVRGQPFLFLEYVSGGDLSNWIGTPRLTEDLPQVLRFAIQFCDGMIHALSKGIKAHRDIKPQNCLITKDNVLKVTDFGLAKIFDETLFESPIESASRDDVSNMLLSRTGSASGTPPYMAPEQFDDVKHVGVRADIYSFGIMLFQMLEGRLPFSARTWSDMERLHKSEPPPRLTTKCWPIAGLVERCLAKHPEQRFENFDVVREILGQIFENLTGEPARAPAVGRKLEAGEHHNKGASLNALGHDEAAITCYDLALELRPDDADTHYNKGVSLRALGHDEEAIACYDRAIQLRPAHADAHYNKGVSLRALGHDEEAIACYDRSIELRPAHADAHYNKGVSLGALGHDQEAIACYDRAIALRPDDANAHHNKGLSLGALGHDEEAIACYDRAIQLRPDDADAYYAKGFSLRALGHDEAAIACYDRAIELRPDHADTHYNKGLILSALGRRDEEAIACYDRALELRPDDADAHYNKGLSLRALGHHEAAIACDDRAIELRPDDARAHYNKGRSLYALGHYEEAIACFDRTIELRPDDANAHHNKGLSLGALGHYEEAIACLDRAIALKPLDSNAHFGRGCALEALGRLQEALIAYQGAHDLGDVQAAKKIEAIREKLLSGNALRERPGFVGNQSF